jgi:hypothetical protein
MHMTWMLNTMPSTHCGQGHSVLLNCIFPSNNTHVHAVNPAGKTTVGSANFTTLAVKRVLLTGAIIYDMVLQKRFDAAQHLFGVVMAYVYSDATVDNSADMVSAAEFGVCLCVVTSCCHSAHTGCRPIVWGCGGAPMWCTTPLHHQHAWQATNGQ